jgi:sodium/proline symporter
VLVFLLGTIEAGGIATVSRNLSSIPGFADLFGIAVPVDSDGVFVSAGLNNVQAVVDGRPAFGPDSSYSLLSILSCLAWGLGYFGMPQVLLRFMAIRKTSEVKFSRIIAVTWCVISLFAAVAIGMTGRALYPTLLVTASGAETIFIHISVNLLPPILAGLILSGILAASMSSSDSYMLIASSALANDLVRGILKKDTSDKTIMWIARITLVLVTLFGICTSLSGSDSIFRVVSYAWAGLGAAFGPLILFSLYWKRTTLKGAVAGMFTGGTMVVIWKEFIRELGGIFGVYELLPAFILSSIAILVVSLLTMPPSVEIQSEFEKARSTRI